MEEARQYSAVKHAPETGAVIGVDVGYSPTRRSSAVCRLWWTGTVVGWEVDRFRYQDVDRELAFRKIAGAGPVLVAAFDGPLRRGLDQIGRYREAERLLTVKNLRSRIGKPGQSSSRNGRDLNAAANICVAGLMDVCEIGPAKHPEAIHDLSVVEAFPTSFLGVLLNYPEKVAVRPPSRSDAYFSHLAESGGLNRLLHHLLPDRRTTQNWRDVRDHDERAAIICALTALCVAAQDYVAVGDDDGWIILPPDTLIAPWALDLLPRRKTAALT